MYYYFQDYQFDSNSLLLSQQGQLLVLRNNEARLLHFFLSTPAQVYSKEQILAAVWQDKVVSEQAVFQAISNLRQQFGDTAIRTFPKKGYQWQLATESAEVARTALPLQREAEAKPTASLVSASPQIMPAPLATPPRSPRYGLLLLLCLATVLGLATVQGLKSWWSSAPTATAAAATPVIELMVQFFVAGDKGQTPPVAEAFSANVRQALGQKTDWQITAPPETASEAQLWASPQLFIKSELINAGPVPTANHILLTGRLSISQNQYRLRLALQGAQNRWQYQLQAGSEPELQQQLIDLLQLIVPQPVLWTSQDQRLINAQWQLLLHQAPQYSPKDTPSHAPIQLQLQKSRVQSELSLGDFAAAQLHSEQLFEQAGQQQNITQQVFALQQQAEIALRQIDVDRAQQLFDRAMVLAQQTGDVRLQAVQHKLYFSVWYARHDFARLEADLLQALQLARSLNDQALVATSLMDLTIASFKFDLPAKQNDYFIQTQNQLTVLQLAPENFAELELFSGVNVQDKQQAEQLFLQALQRFTPQQRSTTKSQLQQQLVTLYLRQQRPAAARALFQTAKEFSAHEQLLLATIAQAEQQMAVARQHASAAFSTASLAGEYLVALDASLLLLQLPAGNETEQARKETQREYLRKNATPAWRKQHQQALSALQL